MTRRLHAGRAAETGVTAALLAQAGFDGPEAIIEGEFGIYSAFGGHVPDLDAVTNGLGTDWQATGAWLKNYPCNGLFQAPLDAMLAILEQENLRANEVSGVNATIARATALHERPSAVTPVNAQFSLHYCLALALLRGRPRAEMFLEDSLASREVRDAMDKIDVVLDAELNRRFGGSSRPGRIEIVLQDGRTLVNEVIFPKGHPKNPMAWNDVRNKYRELMFAAAPTAEAGGLERMIRCLDTADIVPRFDAR